MSSFLDRLVPLCTDFSQRYAGEMDEDICGDGDGNLQQTWGFAELLYVRRLKNGGRDEGMKEHAMATIM